ncbi:MAG: AAA family ATPase [Thermonemataceae bacterium]
MIPIQLTLQGVYSYQATQTIDFTPLVQARLFGVFGSVGSGKSTILEAITYALYGHLDRMHTKDELSYNLMNLRSNELLIDFRFKMQSSEAIYRFVVKGKRATKDFQKVKLERSAYIQKGEDWLPLTTHSAEEILGLSYENFCRTIIIPQGKFAAFLQLNKSERSKMLEDIFKLEKFNLSQKVKRLKASSLEQLNKLEGGLLQLAHIAPDLIEKAKADKAVLTQSLTQQQEVLKEKKAAFQQLEALKALFEVFDEKKQRLAQQAKEKSHFDKLAQQLEDFQYCQTHFQPLLTQLQTQQAQLDELTSTLQALAQEEAQWQQKVTALDIQYRRIQGEFKERDQLYIQAEDYQKLIEIKQIQTTLVELDRALAEAEASKLQVAQQHEAVTKALSDGQEASEALQAALPDLLALNAIEKWWIAQQHLLTAQAQIKEEYQKEENALQKILQEEVAQIEVQINARSTLDRKEKVSDTILASLVLLEKHIAEEEKKQLALEVHHALAHHAEALRQEGGACPLCGATTHPQLIEGESIATQLQQCKAALQSLKDEHQALLQYINLLDTLSTRYKSHQQRMQVLETRLNSTKRELEAHQEARTSLSYKDYTEAEIQALKQSFEEQSAQQQQLQQTLQAQRQTAKDLNEQLLSTEHQYQDLAKQQAQANTKVELLKQQLVRIKYADNTNNEVTSLQEEQAYLRHKYEQLAHDFEKIQMEANEAKETLQALQTKQQVATDRQVNLTTQQQTTQQLLERNLAQSRFSLEEVQQLLAESIDVSQTREAIDRYHQHYQTLQQEVAQLEDQLKGKSFNATQFEALTSEINGLQYQIDEQLQQLGDLKGKIQDWEQQWKEKQQLEKQLATLEAKKMNIQKLESLFRGNAFVNYISTVYLQNLCEQANERFFKLTHQQLRLELEEDNQFIVRDFLNEGKKRSVKTLSGGQTFQASLCLALALADSVMQQNQASQNFFFIDEGFGSQDKQTLQVVFDTLKSLQRENRIVGFISHVEELQQEISVHLRIARDAETGSKIQESWR